MVAVVKTVAMVVQAVAPQLERVVLAGKVVLALTVITTEVVEEVVLPVIQVMVVVVLTTTQVHFQGKTLMVREAAVAVVQEEAALQVQVLAVA